MSLSAGRILSKPRPLRSLAAIARQHPQRMFVSTKNPEPPKPIEPSNTQSMPLGAYYESILITPQPIPEEKPEEPPASSTEEPETPSPPKGRGRKAKEEKPSTSTPKKAAAPEPSTSTSPPVPTPPPKSAQAQAKIVFGSRLAGPMERAERLAELRSRSTLVAGVLVPPKPSEPDNCCMSGCVNCVWDRFRDEMEDWATASAKAEKRLRAQEAGLASNATVPPPAGVSGVSARGSDHHAASMDEDGGGSETNWDSSGKDPERLAKNFWDEELYQNVPVGIREFMKQEKRLKEKHLREGTVGS